MAESEGYEVLDLECEDWDSEETPPAEILDIDAEGSIDLFDGSGYDSFAVEATTEEDERERPRQVQALATSVLGVLAKFGFTGQRLALQEGEESELLTQALQELELVIDVQTRALILPYLYEAVERAVRELPLSKRAKGDSAPLGWQRAWDAVAANEAKVHSEEEAVRVLTAPARGTKGIQKFDQQIDPEAHQVRLRQDAEKFRLMQAQLVDFLIEAQAPILAQLELSCDPRRALLGVIGKTRMNTAAKYLRHWVLYRDWLQVEKGYPWPRSVSDLIDYLFVLRDKPCYPTIPQTWYQATCWIFHKGGFEGEAFLPGKSLLTENLNKLILDLGQNQQPTLQAARYPIGVLAALEIYVADKERLPFKRLIAASMLFRAWGTLRLDDLQHMRRNTLRLVGDLLTTELSCTKTTGPGKRVRQLPVAVSSDAQILPMQWVAVFLELLQEHLPSDKDFLLENPTRDFKGTTGSRLTHAQATAISKQIVAELMVPVLTAGGWVFGTEKLVPLELEGLFSQHSGRAVLPSMAIHIENDKSKRDCLGRWKPSASDDYMRTYRTVVAAIQVRTAKAIQTGHPEIIKEHDIVDRAARYLREGKGLAEGETAKICKAWQGTLSGFSLYLKDRWVENTAAESASLSLLAAASSARVKSFDPCPIEKGVQRVKVSRKERFLITYSRNRRISRLHSTEKGCYWAGIEVRDFWIGDVVDETLYNRRCKFCWPSLLGKIKLQDHEEDSSSSSDSCGEED